MGSVASLRAESHGPAAPASVAAPRYDFLFEPDPAGVMEVLLLYLLDYRNQGIFYEAATNKILDDLVTACQPRRMTVTGAFTARGGITTTVVATHPRP